MLIFKEELYQVFAKENNSSGGKKVIIGALPNSESYSCSGSLGAYAFVVMKGNLKQFLLFFHLKK